MRGSLPPIPPQSRIGGARLESDVCSTKAWSTDLGHDTRCRQCPQEGQAAPPHGALMLTLGALAALDVDFVGRGVAGMMRHGVGIVLLAAHLCGHAVASSH
jgi:hypothetical protein